MKKREKKGRRNQNEEWTKKCTFTLVVSFHHLSYFSPSFFFSLTFSFLVSFKKQSFAPFIRLSFLIFMERQTREKELGERERKKRAREREREEERKREKRRKIIFISETDDR